MDVKVEYPYYKIDDTIIDRSKLTSIRVDDLAVEIRLGSDYVHKRCRSNIEVDLLLHDLMYKPK